MPDINPFRGAHLVPYRGRTADHTRRALSWEEPLPRVPLDDERRFKERCLLRALTSDDPVHRLLALNVFNDAMQAAVDQIIRLSSTSAFPTQTTQGVPAAIVLGDAQREMVDTRWASFFTVQDRRQQSHPFFKIANTYHAVTIDQYQLGEQVKIRAVEGDETIYEAYVYAGGLQWNQLWSEWQDLWSQQDGVQAMQTKWLNKMASIAYAVVIASGISNTAYDTTGSTTLEKDVNTINDGITAIESALYTATAPQGGQQTEEIVSDAAPYYLLYNSLTAGYEKRINRALATGYLLPNDSNSTVQLNRPVVPVGSPYVTTGAWYLTLGGRKNIMGVFRDLRMFDINDPRVAGVAAGQVAQGAFRAVRGDANQTRKLLLS